MKMNTETISPYRVAYLRHIGPYGTGNVQTMTCFATTAFAEGDPITVVNNLSSFIFGLIRAIGMILLGFGIVQIGLSLKFHDPSQRANRFMTLAGGVLIAFAKKDFEFNYRGVKQKSYPYECIRRGYG